MVLGEVIQPICEFSRSDLSYAGYEISPEKPVSTIIALMRNANAIHFVRSGGLVASGGSKTYDAFTAVR